MTAYYLFVWWSVSIELGCTEKFWMTYINILMTAGRTFKKKDEYHRNFLNKFQMYDVESFFTVKIQK